MRLPLFLLMSCVPVLALAAPVPVSAEKAPLEITADKALEWNQTAKTYTARGHAIAKQNDLSVTADILTATYAGKDGSTSDLILLNADEHVVLKTATDTATGDAAIYDMVTGEATLSGSGSGTRPKIVQSNGSTLEADQIKAWTKTADGKPGLGQLDRAEATGHVVITGKNQVATGDKATYVAATTMAELIGHVKITQDKNVLEGDKAEMNLATHISKMTGQKGSGRVKGVFYPGTGKK
mgnify:FL=1